MGAAIDRHFFFEKVRAAPFGGSLTGSQVTGMEAILACWERLPYVDLRWLAYCLATTYWETARTMQPIEEIGKGRGRAYGAPTGPWRLVYDGRGDVQLTWEANYKRAASELLKLGIVADLDRHPELAMRPDIAALVLIVGCVEGWFTGHKLSDYFDAYVADPVGARRIVNGEDHAGDIAGFYRSMDAGLMYASPTTAPARFPPPPAPAVVVASPAPTGGMLGWLKGLFGG